MISTSLILLVTIRTIRTADENLSVGGSQRPFYIIGHMANSVERMDAYLAEGANALEVDLACDANGTAATVYHGMPCFEMHGCFDSANFTIWLDAARTRTFALLMVDFKCNHLNETGLRVAGADVAEKLVKHFWTGSTVNVVLSIPTIKQQAILAAFVGALQLLKPSARDRVAHDVSESPNIDEVEKMYRALNITSAFQGEGIISPLERFRGHSYLKKAISRRETGASPLKKVYRWTVDSEGSVRQLIRLGADGVITNKPEHVTNVLKEFKEVRLANSDDPITIRFRSAAAASAVNSTIRRHTNVRRSPKTRIFHS